MDKKRLTCRLPLHPSLYVLLSFIIHCCPFTLDLKRQKGTQMHDAQCTTNSRWSLPNSPIPDFSYPRHNAPFVLQVFRHHERKYLTLCRHTVLANARGRMTITSIVGTVASEIPSLFQFSI